MHSAGDHSIADIAELFSVFRPTAPVASLLLRRVPIAMWIFQKGVMAALAAETERTALVLLAGDRVLRADLHTANRVCDRGIRGRRGGGGARGRAHDTAAAAQPPPPRPRDPRQGVYAPMLVDKRVVAARRPPRHRLARRVAGIALVVVAAIVAMSHLLDHQSACHLLSQQALEDVFVSYPIALVLPIVAEIVAWPKQAH